MLHLLTLFLAAAAPTGSALPPGTIIGMDPRPGPMPVTDKMLIPGRVPECTDIYQAQRAEEEKIRGYEPECMRPLKKDRNPPRS
jgi:hypothetical protein